MKGVNAKKQIIEGAIQQFSKDGYFDVSIQKIADSIGIKQTALLYHFQSKELLIKACLEFILENNSSIVQKNTSLSKSKKEKLLSHFESNLEWAEKYPDEARLILLLYYYSSFHPQFKNYYSLILKAARDKICKIISEGTKGKSKAELQMKAEILHDSLLAGILNHITVNENLKNTKKLKKKWGYLINSVVL